MLNKITRRAPRLSSYGFRLRRLATIIRGAAARSGPLNFNAIARDLLYGTSLGQRTIARLPLRSVREQVREYAVELPTDYPAGKVHVRLSVPNLKPRPFVGFSDHVLDQFGRATDIVLASTTGGFALSTDLGRSWEHVKVRDKHFAKHQFIHLKSIGDGELLAQAAAESWRPGLPRELDILVLNLHGDVLAATHMSGSHWHGCRSVDMANGTLMYAEYPYEDPAGTLADRAVSRVLRSRDRGRSWESVFERQGTQIRHFHFLQARPGFAGEWWLTSGDKPLESCVWVSKDDGDSWVDVTTQFGEQVPITGIKFPRTVFRLTDLVWEGSQILWGTDDYLARNRFSAPGARMFRSPAERLSPTFAGLAKWQIRNIVEVDQFYVILTQGCARPDATAEEKRPGVYLMPKQPIEGAPGMIHLFDVDMYSTTRTGFTYSRASRSAKEGAFFSYRASTDAFPFGHRLLKWEVVFS